MSTIEVYTFEDADGNEVGSYTTQNPTEAREYAMRCGLNVRANEYEYADSSLVDEWSYAKKDNDEETAA